MKSIASHLGGEEVPEEPELILNLENTLSPLVPPWDQSLPQSRALHNHADILLVGHSHLPRPQ